MVLDIIAKYKFPWKLIGWFSNNDQISDYIKNLYLFLSPNPKTLQLHINTNCNYNCLFCYQNRKNIKVIPTKKIISLIKEAKELGVKYVDFLGGEPLLHNDLFKILDFTAKQKLGITIFTNGILINGTLIKKFKKINSKLTLVIHYDYDDKIYSSLTQTKTKFNKVTEIIRKCISNGITVITFTVITKQNYKYIDKMISNSNKLGAYAMFERYLPVKNEKINKYLEISNLEWINVLKPINSHYKEEALLIKGFGNLKSGVCSCYMQNLSVTPDGFVLPCPETPLELNVGNVKDQSLEQIWKTFKKKRKEWSILPSECKSCQSKNICNGGCKAHTYIKFKNFNKRDPLCASNIPTTYPHCIFTISRIFKQSPPDKN